VQIPLSAVLDDSKAGKVYLEVWVLSQREPPAGDVVLYDGRTNSYRLAILALPRRHGHYIVDVDASYEQLGFCLQQQHSEEEYHPIGYYSRALLPSEKNSFAAKIEALGVICAVTYLWFYLEGAEFVVRCDHRAYLSVLTNMSPNARINRWRLRLSEYNFEIRRDPGKDHKVADALSRLPTEGLGTSPLDEDIPVMVFETGTSDALKEASPEEAPMGALSGQDIILGQAEDY